MFIVPPKGPAEFTQRVLFEPLKAGPQVPAEGLKEAPAKAPEVMGEAKKGVGVRKTRSTMHKILAMVMVIIIAITVFVIYTPVIPPPTPAKDYAALIEVALYKADNESLRAYASMDFEDFQAARESLSKAEPHILEAYRQFREGGRCFPSRRG